MGHLTWRGLEHVQEVVEGVPYQESIQPGLDEWWPVSRVAVGKGPLLSRVPAWRGCARRAHLLVETAVLGGVLQYKGS